MVSFSAFYDYNDYCYAIFICDDVINNIIYGVGKWFNMIIITSIIVGVIVITISILLFIYSKGNESLLCCSGVIFIIGIFLIVQGLGFIPDDKVYAKFAEDEFLPIVLKYDQNNITVHENSSFYTYKEPSIKGKLVYIDAYEKAPNDTNSHLLTNGSWGYIKDFVPTDLRYDFDPNTINNTKITFFIRVYATSKTTGAAYAKEEIYGQGRYVGQGQIPVTDIMVIYWPSKVVAGTYRIIGDAPPERTNTTLEGDTNIEDWINSRPKEN